MTIVIQNCKTNLYLHANGEWTEDVSAAARFGSSAEALQFTLENSLPQVQIVLKFRDEAQDIVLPVSDDCRRNGLAA
jgi:hypothetical protein